MSVITATSPQSVATVFSPDHMSEAPLSRLDTLRTMLFSHRSVPFAEKWDFLVYAYGRKSTTGASGEGQNSTAQPPSSPNGNTNPSGPTAADYDNSFVRLTTITDIKEFFEVFNNFNPLSLLPGSSIHLFRAGIKPVWESPENRDGGAWSFRMEAVPPATTPLSSSSASTGTDLDQGGGLRTPDSATSARSRAATAAGGASESFSWREVAVVRCWTEICLLVTGGTLPGAIAAENLGKCFLLSLSVPTISWSGGRYPSL